MGSNPLSNIETIAATRHDDEPRAERLSLADLYTHAEERARLTHYVLLGRLGQGGMGVVFSAYDERLDRKVAVKVLRHTVGQEGRRRLVREAQALARISHPNVVQIHEIGEHRGLTFIVMEQLEGITLRKWLAERSPSVQQVIEVFVAAGRGLVAAHARDVIHRDFKPDNVIVGEQGRVWVLDFGLAREHSQERAPVVDAELHVDVHSSSELSSDLTRTGSLLGTPVYMAPEQLASGTLDARSDQFSFCVALWEALYGQRPFAGDTIEALTLAVTTGALREPPPTKEVPGRVRAWLERGLASRPDERWPSLSELLDALEQRPPRRWPRALALLASLALAGALGDGWWQQRQHRARALELEAQCVALGDAITETWNEARAEQLRAAFEATGLGMAGSSWVHSRAQIDAYVDAWRAQRTQVCVDAELAQTLDEDAHDPFVACLDEGAAGLSALLEAWTEPDEQVVVAAPIAAARLRPPAACSDPLWSSHRVRPPAEHRAEVAALRRELERVRGLVDAGRLEPALELARAELARAERLGWGPSIAEARLGLGEAEVATGEYERARASLELASLEALGSGNDLVALSSAIVLGHLLGDHLHEHEQARYWNDYAARFIERLGLAGTEREATALNSRGTAASSRGDYDAALGFHRAALELRVEIFGEQHPATARSLNNLGDMLSSLGRLDEALEVQRRAYAIVTQVLGPEHLNASYSLNNIANIHSAQGRYADSLAELREALRIREQALHPDHPRLINVLNNLGNTSWQLGEYEQALASFERGIDIAEARGGPEDPQVGMLLVGVGITRLSQGRASEALAAHRRALELLAPALGPEHAHVATMNINIGDALIALERHAEALEAHERALSIAEAALGPEHDTVAYALHGIGVACEGLGELERARAALERAVELREHSGAPKTQAAAHFALARVRAKQGAREPALTLAARARSLYLEAGKGSEAELAELDAWLAKLP